MSLRKIVFNTATISSVNVFRLLAQFISVPILSRILSPADYGVVAMASPFMLFALIIADAGIGMSLVRTPASETRIWSTCFWLSVVLGFMLALIMSATSPLVARIFAEPALAPLVTALGVAVILQAISTVPGVALQQNHRFKTIASIEIASVIIGIAVAVTIALKGGGAWALVGQQLVFFALRLLLTLIFSPFRPRMVFDFHSVGEHMVFGRDILSVNIIGFFTRSIDNLVIGKVLNSSAVGVYSMAFQFARIPIMIVSGPLQYVIYSHLALVKNDIVVIRKTFLVITRLLAVLVFPVMGMVAVDHDAVFTLLLSKKWFAAGEFFMIIAPATALQAVNALGGTTVMVMGRTDIQLRMTIEFGLIWIAALLISVYFGLTWAAIAFNIVVILYSVRSLMLFLPLMECQLSTYLRTITIPVIMTFVCIALFWSIHNVLPASDWLQLALGAVLAALGVGLSALVQRHVITEEIISWKQVSKGKLMPQV